MRLATLNISGPSLRRAESLLAYLRALDADVLVLTETRGNEGTRHLFSSLEGEGWTVLTGGTLGASERGVAVAHRMSVSRPIALSAGHDVAHRLIGTMVDPGMPIAVFGAYVPSRDASPSKIERKRRFLDELLRLSKGWAGKPVVFLGDLNIVGRQHVPHFTAFRGWEYEALEALEARGMVDAHTQLHPGRQVHSWIGRKGAGYRYDYAFVSDVLSSTITDCRYLHDAREAGLTDHAAVVLSLDLARASDLDTSHTERSPELVSA